MPVWFWVTAVPPLPLLLLAIAAQPDMTCIHAPQHYVGVRATRIVRRLQTEWARRPRPAGPPAWTVEVTTR